MDYLMADYYLPFYRWGSGGIERYSNMAKVTQLVTELGLNPGSLAPGPKFLTTKLLFCVTAGIWDPC